MTDLSSSPPTLRRSLNLPLLTLYGLGVTVGAGIYVLIGVTASHAGPLAWLSFLIAGAVVAFTAFSYAELATRFPVSAGEAAYVDAGLGRPALSVIVGLAVAASGMVSASAITIGAAAYLGQLTGVTDVVLILCVVIGMGFLAWWGIMQSVAIASVVTVIEILGLLIVILWGFGFAEQNGVNFAEMMPTAGAIDWDGIAAASLLAFFAFVGFEDVVNVAEEAQDPRRNLPRAIFLVLIVALVLYAAVCIATLRVVPIDTLAGSPRPLALVFADAPQWLATGFVAVAGVATINGVLIQMIMASRVLYGMANKNLLPKALAVVSGRTRTPTVATGVVTLFILVLSLFFPIERLAGWTSQIVLAVFVIVNVALIALKRRPSDGDHFSTPMAVPVLGVITSLALFATMIL